MDAKDTIEKQPNASLEECRIRLCEKFASITSSDDAVAQCYLAENDWDMERALNSFFEEDMKAVFDADQDANPKKEPPQTSKNEAGAVDCIDLTEEDPSCSGADSTDGKRQQAEPDDDCKLSLLTWNVDGLDTGNLAERARGLCSVLVLYTPDVVFLQELIPPYMKYLKKRATSYIIIEGNEDGYFTGIMLKKTRVKLLKSEIISYPATQMLRNLLVAQVRFLDQDICLMTSHLESCKEQAQERMNQLRVVLRRMKEAPDNVSVVFGGDTNLRDPEVLKVGGLPAGVCDVWEQLGRQEHCRYTWDTKGNSNKGLPYVSRCRFDRIYFRPAGTGSRLAPDHMNLVGLEKLDCGRHISDHWGIYCTFTLAS
ncbi:tyrosyl-DNA phosphodiesterase 2 isoform X1 [Paramormyrops kingsleyae]|uniref:Tyrosyl-DNA phosphodiesterase 2 n=2 Tax=Paramormyrops kingsleyae TaxID=1676925 RepID=A0A3B3RXJ7_9TELE|nr:tyrosyl-DNA phosphodiesterase 2 isoform X1 [Paramormyrops kingsleyae]